MAKIFSDNDPENQDVLPDARPAQPTNLSYPIPKEEKSVDKHENLAKKLKWIREAKGYTYVEFAKELGLSKSTIESVISSGHMTLHTAVQISDRLGIPLDILLSDEPLNKEFDVVRWFMRGISTFKDLSGEQQDKITIHLNEILDILRDDPESNN